MLNLSRFKKNPTFNELLLESDINYVIHLVLENVSVFGTIIKNLAHNKPSKICVSPAVFKYAYK